MTTSNVEAADSRGPASAGEAPIRKAPTGIERFDEITGGGLLRLRPADEHTEAHADLPLPPAVGRNR